MTRLVFKIEKDEDGIWTAIAIDAGITTQGNTLDELFKNILEAVKLHLENDDPKIELLFDMQNNTAIYA